MPLLTYEQALAFWFGRINYEQRTPLPGDLKLDRMRALLALLGTPQERLRIVHVAGSKGKGSTSAMLAAALRRAGYRVGLFTSPHLTRVEERIQVDGVPVTPDALAALVAAVQPAVEALAAGEGAATFFEVATALGFLHFARCRVDVAVIEVGLGGRFDSTNVCRPLVAVITSISLDHTQQLGTSVASIAGEKAGIVKPGRPVVSGATGPVARQVIQSVCRERGAPLRQLGTDFRYRYEPGRVASDSATRHSALSPQHFLRRPRVQVVTEERAWPPLELDLLGEHQAANAAVAVACVEQLRREGLSIADGAVAAGLGAVGWPARMEVLGRRPLVVLDCAHNVASAQALVATLLTSFPPRRRLLVFAGSGDKDLAGMFRVLAPHFTHAFLTRYGNSPRGVPPGRLAELLRQVADLPATTCATPAEAWQAARAMATAENLICVTGSVFLAGELRPVLLRE
jgi:dihydrofolate synthase/folylpolyglutamate synthase